MWYCDFFQYSLQSKLKLIFERSMSKLLSLTFLLSLSFTHVSAESAYAPSMPIAKALADDLQSGEKGQERD